MGMAWWFDPEIRSNTTLAEREAMLDYLHEHEDRRHVTFLVSRTGLKVMAFTDSKMNWLISLDTMSGPGTRFVHI